MIVHAAADVGGVAAEGAVGQRGRAVIVQAAADVGGVAADGAVGQRVAVLRLDTPPPSDGASCR